MQKDFAKEGDLWGWHWQVYSNALTVIRKNVGQLRLVLWNEHLESGGRFMYVSMGTGSRISGASLSRPKKGGD